MLQAMLLKSGDFLVHTVLLPVGVSVGYVLAFLAVFLILSVSVGMILLGAAFLVEAVLEIALGVWAIIPFWGSEAKIWDVEGSLMWGVVDLLGAAFTSGLGWAIFHFLFPDDKKPKRLRRKRGAKKSPPPVSATTP